VIIYKICIHNLCLVFASHLHIKIRVTDCESLIRKMLVLEPSKRYTIPQIKRHRWMAGTADSICSVIITRPSSSIQEPNEQILRLMHSLGIDISRTREVRKIFFSLLSYIKLGIYIHVIFIWYIYSEKKFWHCPKQKIFTNYTHIISIYFLLYYVNTNVIF